MSFIQQGSYCTHDDFMFFWIHQFKFEFLFSLHFLILLLTFAQTLFRLTIVLFGRTVVCQFLFKYLNNYYYPFCHVSKCLHSMCQSIKFDWKQWPPLAPPLAATTTSPVARSLARDLSRIRPFVRPPGNQPTGSIKACSR